MESGSRIFCHLKQLNDGRDYLKQLNDGRDKFVTYVFGEG